jgi:SAM-dependent methyltransferase
MYFVERSLRFMRGAIATYGPSFIKKALWDKEYSSGKWNFNDNTSNDCVYPYLEKYAGSGSILDIGCGSGNTANEMAVNAYGSYLGVDISVAALEKARRWSEANGRAQKNSFAQADFLKYEPGQRFHVILFRESLYLVPLGSVKATLDRYSKHLEEDGVLIVRIATIEKGNQKHRPSAMIRTIEDSFDVLEKGQFGESGATVIVFRSRAAAEIKHSS